jgi:hypothetical protein
LGTYDRKIVKAERERLAPLIDGILYIYFNKWWQIQQSAQLGGGLWDIEPKFRDFVLSYKLTEKRRSESEMIVTKLETPLKKYDQVDTSMVPTEYVEGNDNYKEVIAIAKANRAVNEQLLYGEITKPFLESVSAIVFYDETV